MAPRALRPLLILLVALTGCAALPRALPPPASARNQPASRSAWARERLDDAARGLTVALGRDGAAGLVRLRLQPTELRALFTSSAQRRLAEAVSFSALSDDERRWRLFGRLAQGGAIGYCARGVRFVAARDDEGFVGPALVVDRLLVVLDDGSGSRGRGAPWGAWIEGLVLTDGGWRLRPDVPIERQVEAPRWGHSDVALWDCDVGRAPPLRGLLVRRERAGRTR